MVFIRVAITHNGQPERQSQVARGFKDVGNGSWKKPVACTNLGLFLGLF